MSRFWFRAFCITASSLLIANFFSFAAYRNPQGELLVQRSAGKLLIGAYGLILVLALVLAFVGYRGAHHVVQRLTRIGAALRGRPWLQLFLAITPIVALGITIEQLVQFGPIRSRLFQTSALGLVFLAAITIVVIGRPVNEARLVVARVIILGITLLVTLVGVEYVLRSAPFLVPSSAEAHLRGARILLRRDLVWEPRSVIFRYAPLLDQNIEVRLSQGDLYAWQPGDLRPIPPAEDTVLARVHFQTDENGYPNPPPLAERYDIVVTGDSFTSAVGVAEPWPRVVAGLSGRSVLNLAMPGYSTRLEVEAVKAYGLARRPSWIVVGFFEGNDLLIEAGGFETIRQSGLSWPEFEQRQAGPYHSSLALQTIRWGIPQVIERLWTGPSTGRGSIASSQSDGYRYPMMVEAGDRSVPLALFNRYVAALAVSRAQIEASPSLSLVTTALLELRDAAQQTGAHVLLVYIPSKEHVYAPLLLESHWQHVLTSVQPLPGFDADAGVSRPTSTIIRARADDQRAVLSEFAARSRIEFIDLTPSFMAAAAGGRELYSVTDTHWNQAGHDLAAETVVTFIDDRSSSDVGESKAER